MENQLGLSFPPDYREFMIASDGAEGRVGAGSYLQLWAVEELPQLNQIARTSHFAPGMILFGSDGGSASYAFDARQEDDILFVELPDYPFMPTRVTMLGRSLREFLEALSGQHPQATRASPKTDPFR